MTSAATADAVHGTSLLSAAAAPLRGAPDCRALWDELAAVGLPALLVPAASGGLGRGLSAAVPVAAGLSGQARSLPFVVSAVLATRLLEAVGAGSLLTELATGDRVLAVDIAAGVVGPAYLLDHELCGSALRLRAESDAVGLHLAERQLGRISQEAVRRALDDASVVAAAELLAVVEAGRAGRSACAVTFAEDLVATAAAASDVDAPGRSRAAAGARAAVVRLAPAQSLPWRDPWPALLRGGWSCAA